MKFNSEENDTDLAVIFNYAKQLAADGHYKEANVFFSFANKMNPKNTNYIYYLGLNLFHLKEYKTALACLYPCALINTDNPQYVYLIALNFIELDNHQCAEVFLKYTQIICMKSDKKKWKQLYLKADKYLNNMTYEGIGL